MIGRFQVRGMVTGGYGVYDTLAGQFVLGSSGYIRRWSNRAQADLWASRWNRGN